MVCKPSLYMIPIQESNSPYHCDCGLKAALTAMRISNATAINSLLKWVFRFQWSVHYLGRNPCAIIFPFSFLFTFNLLFIFIIHSAFQFCSTLTWLQFPFFHAICTESAYNFCVFWCLYIWLCFTYAGLKPVVKKVWSVVALMDEKYRIMHFLLDNPLARLVPLPTHPLDFTPGKCLIQECADTLDLDPMKWLWPKELKLIHMLDSMQTQKGLLLGSS